MGIDKEKILSLIGEIEKSVNILREYAKEEKEKFVKDMKSLGSVKYYLIVANEACVDICNHIMAKEHMGIPESYSECFTILEHKGIITGGLSNKLVNMAKFRNLLVHLYWKVDDNKYMKYSSQNLMTLANS